MWAHASPRVGSVWTTRASQYRGKRTACHNQSRIGAFQNSGALVTRSGLVFIGGGDGYVYAFDTRTGSEVWRAKVPYANTATPMTYRTRSGRGGC
jgi:glucose dehydrogenase